MKESKEKNNKDKDDQDGAVGAAPEAENGVATAIPGNGKTLMIEDLKEMKMAELSKTAQDLGPVGKRRAHVRVRGFGDPAGRLWLPAQLELQLPSVSG